MTKLEQRAAGVALLAALLASTSALAKPGFMTCQVADSEKAHVFFSERAFAADSGDAEKAFDVYVKALMGEKVPLLKSLDHAKGICNWEETRAEANKKTSMYVINFIKQGYLTYGDSHMSDPFVP